MRPLPCKRAFFNFDSRFTLHTRTPLFVVFFQFGVNFEGVAAFLGFTKRNNLIDHGLFRFIRQGVGGKPYHLARFEVLNVAFSDLQFGANFSKRTKDRSTDEGLIVSATNGGRDPINFPSGSYIERNVGGTGFKLASSR